MKHISIDPRFVNKTGNDLIPSKIHTILQNYEYWKRFEGKKVALFTWEGKPYQKGSKQKVFCVKRIMSVQKVVFTNKGPEILNVWKKPNKGKISSLLLCVNDGFENYGEFHEWFCKYKSSKMAILHFTGFMY